jgi:hypothetical protein
MAPRAMVRDTRSARTMSHHHHLTCRRQIDGRWFEVAYVVRDAYAEREVAIARSDGYTVTIEGCNNLDHLGSAQAGKSSAT